ncbi:MAG: hypothetical protein IJ740_02165 [Ruminococcus sp.]|nr:hypothetical protein [Ruminococcus sp.]
MLKFIGLAMIFLFFILLSLSAVGGINDEYRKTVIMCDMLFDIRSYIGFESMKLSEIICELSKNESYLCFDFLGSFDNMSDIKKSLLDRLNTSPPFKTNEYNDRIIRLFRLIGESDRQSQTELVSGVLQYFEGQACILREEIPVKTRLYRALGVAAGGIAALMLL